MNSDVILCFSSRSWSVRLISLLLDTGCHPASCMWNGQESRSNLRNWCTEWSWWGQRSLLTFSPSSRLQCHLHKVNIILILLILYVPNYCDKLWSNDNGQDIKQFKLSIASKGSLESCGFGIGMAFHDRPIQCTSLWLLCVYPQQEVDACMLFSLYYGLKGYLILYM